MQYYFSSTGCVGQAYNHVSSDAKATLVAGWESNDLAVSYVRGKLTNGNSKFRGGIIKFSSNDSKINNIETWTDAFITYESIYTTGHPRRTG